MHEVFDELNLGKQQSNFLEDIMQALDNMNGGEAGINKGMRGDKFPYCVISIIGEYLEHYDSLMNLAIASRHFYIAMQLRYKSLCIKLEFIPNTEKITISSQSQSPEEIKDQLMFVKKKSEKQQIIDTKN